MTVTGGPALGGVEGRLGFTIAVPASWYELELKPALRQDAIRRLVEDRVRGTDDLWQQRRSITRLLTAQAEAAWESGAIYCAGFSLPTPEGPVTGSLTVSLVDDPLAGTGAAAEERFPTVARTEDPTAPYAETSVVEIPGAGPCPRSHGIEDTPVGDGRLLRNVFTVTAVPLPALDRAFLIAASSPVLPLADALHDLFDAVTGTFRVVPLGEKDDVTTQGEEADVAPR